MTILCCAAAAMGSVSPPRKPPTRPSLTIALVCSVVFGLDFLRRLAIEVRINQPPFWPLTLFCGVGHDWIKSHNYAASVCAVDFQFLAVCQNDPGDPERRRAVLG